MDRHRWIRISATAAAIGGAAWLAKFVVAAIDYENPATSVLYVIGVLLLFLGSTWLGALLAGDGSRWLLAPLVLLSPLAFWMSYTALDAVGLALVGDDAADWLRSEAGIALTGALWLVSSAWVLRTPRRVASLLPS
jgi:hypothetical protein